MKFTDLFVKRPVLASVISLLILLVGVRAIFSLEVRQYPETKNTVVTVTTTYPGAGSACTAPCPAAPSDGPRRPACGSR